MHARALMLLVAGGVVIATSSGNAQLPDATPMLPEDVWQAASFSAPDGAAQCEFAPAEEAGEPAVARIRVGAAQENAWEVCLAWNSIAPVAAGDVLVLSFEARAEGDSDPPGQIGLVFRRTSKPYQHALSDTVTVGSEWREFRVPFAAPVTMDAGGGTLRINFGGQGQTVELRRLSLVNIGGEHSMLAVCRMLGIDPGAAGRSAVGEHLRPGLLWEMAAFDELPAPDPNFDPAGAWEQTWRIWTCYGYLLRSNQTLGTLRITREPGDPLKLSVEQVTLSAEGQRRMQTAQIVCAPNTLASPLSWTYASSFLAPGGEEIADLSLTRTVDVPPEGPVTADWCLFDAVQRLPFSPEATQRFDLLEGLSLLKRGHEIRYDGPHEVRIGAQTRTLHRFVQTGHGVLPCDWWVGKDHRVVLMVTSCRVYVLDPNAQETFASAVEGQVSRYERLRERQATQEGQGDE